MTLKPRSREAAKSRGLTLKLAITNPGVSISPRPAMAIGDGLVHQAHVWLVDQGSGLQSAVATFTAEISRGKPPQFAIHQRYQFVQRGPPPAAPGQ
jgi:hypothetical protein